LVLAVQISQARRFFVAAERGDSKAFTGSRISAGRSCRLLRRQAMVSRGGTPIQSMRIPVSNFPVRVTLVQFSAGVNKKFFGITRMAHQKDIWTRWTIVYCTSQKSTCSASALETNGGKRRCAPLRSTLNGITCRSASAIRFNIGAQTALPQSQELHLVLTVSNSDF